MKKKIILKKNTINNLFISGGLLVALLTGAQFLNFRTMEVVFVVGDNVSKEYKYSDFFAPLKGTVGDASIYVIGDENPNEPSMLVLGGTHANEPSGQLTATLLLENLQVTKGTVYIITEANRSGYTVSHPQEAAPFTYQIKTPFGSRTFKYGSRATSPIDQWPIPDLYIHESTGQQLSGTDTRNLNRAYPGRPDGTYTEKVTYAIVEFIKQKKITMTVDLHEASPEYAVNNAMVAHQRAMDSGIASLAYMSLEMFGLDDPRFAPLKLEPSPINLRGLTHRELGDNTDTLAFLVESSNASQGRIRGAMSEELIVDGKDKFYEKATKLGILEVDYTNPVTLNERVGRHTQTIIELINAYNTKENNFEGEFAKYKCGKFQFNMNELGFKNIYEKGIGSFLKNPKK